MSNTVIEVDRLSKQYRLGTMGGKRLVDDVNRWWAKLLGKEDPLSKVVPSRVSSRHAQSSEEFFALKDVSFEVKQGEVLGIIGRNGAGKSTLLKILSRVTAPTGGEVRVKGRIASLLEVGTGFHPDLTGRENIFLNGAILGMTKAEIRKKCDDIVAFSEVEKFIDTPVKRYSSGMSVRLAFGVAAFLEPEILIVDEVLAVGDTEFQKKCLGKMQQVSKGEGRTVLFVSHNISAVRQLCSRGILLKGGSVAVDGPIELATGAYLHDGTVAQNGDFDLQSNPSRSRNHQALITRLVVRRENGLSTGRVYPDEEVIFEITVSTPKFIVQPRMAIAVENASGVRLMTMASFFGRGSLPELSGTSTISCHTKALGLGPGRYLLSVCLGDKVHGMLDSLDCAAWLEVEWRNNFGNGEPHYPVYGPVLRSSAWELVSELGVVGR